MYPNIWSLLYELLIPRFCGFCHRDLQSNESLCVECLALITPLPSFTLPLKRVFLLPIRILGTYDDPLRYLVNSKSYTQCKQLGSLLWNFSVHNKVLFDCIVPITNTDQNHWIVRQVSSLSKCPVITQHLLRSKQKNDPFTGKRVILIGTIFAYDLNLWNIANQILIKEPTLVSALFICRPHIKK